MKPFTSCVFVALLSGVLATPAGPAAVAKWESFKAKHGKQHSVHEEPARMQRFLERSAEIDAHNARYEAGLESFSMKPSQYADLTPEEFARSALGFVAAVNASDIPLSEEPMMPSIPSKFDWRDQGIMTPVVSQGYCGSCYAFAGAAALEAYLKWKTGQTHDLSEQDVVDCSYKKFLGNNHNGGCQGGWPTAVYEYYNQKGLVSEREYPYTSGSTKTHGPCRIPNAKNDRVRGSLKIKNVKPKNENEMAALLVSKGPLVIAMAADNEYKRYFNDLGDGVFDMDHAINLGPNHAVVLVGYGNQKGKDYWVIKNSWGKEWAVGGYGKIARGKNMCNLTKFGVWYVEQ
ncbi:zingipain-1 [Galendromus occidentalis]|uniref:Zingipain-1 n=1 Tax=Galendromus occidentalis TaxID=34638 RepID=A0AAJ6QY19_9ACAR|nr:zingipain-1 [Galendromus occidentalis]